MKHLSRKRGEVIERDVSPQRLVYYRDNWYLDAYCHLRDDLRSFSLDAIEAIELLDKPALNVPEKALADYFEQSYGIFNGPSRQVARLRFTAFRARWVARERWHPDQVSAVTSDGAYLLDVPYGEDWELLQDILKQGPDVEVIAPISLREKVQQAIKEMGEVYA